MRTIYSLGLLGSLLLVSGEAKPCGGAFGASYVIQPAQKIVVSYHAGIETYIFNPDFCGKADSFGLILPIPSTLQDIPTLGTKQLYTDLAAVAAPTIVTKTECGSGGNSSWNSNGVGGSKSAGTGAAVTVVQRGQVGIFDWALLKASSVKSFTDWLSTNGFPNQAAASTFQPYVDEGWYFVAFKVSTNGTSGGSAGAAGATAKSTSTSNTTICGSFGPVSLAFPVADRPVIPARIATVSSSSFQWDIFALGAETMQLRNTSASLRFTGAIGETELSTYPSLATLAKPGDRLTELLLSSVPASDLVLEPAASQADFRRTETVVKYVTCAAGAGGNLSAGGQPTGGTAPTLPIATETGGSGIGGANATIGNTGGTSATLAQKSGGTSPTAIAPNIAGGAAIPPHEDSDGCSVAVASTGRTSRGIGLAMLAAIIIRFGRRRVRRRC